MSAYGQKDLGPLELLYAGAERVLDAAQGVSFLYDVSDFIESVTWQEPFILTLLSFQLCLFLVTYLMRNKDIIQFLILLLLTAVSLCAEQLNLLGAKHWKLFATQNYFDRSGLFMLTFVSGPFVILANFIVVSFCYLCFLLSNCFSSRFSHFSLMH